LFKLERKVLSSDGVEITNQQLSQQYYSSSVSHNLTCDLTCILAWPKARPQLQLLIWNKWLHPRISCISRHMNTSYWWTTCMQKRRQQSMRPIYICTTFYNSLSEGNYFTGKVSRLPTNPRKPWNFSTSNNLQYTVSCVILENHLLSCILFMCYTLILSNNFTLDSQLHELTHITCL